MVLDVKEDPKMPLILGRTFMNTIRMVVDIDEGQVKVRIKDYEVCFRVIDITYN